MTDTVLGEPNPTRSNGRAARARNRGLGRVYRRLYTGCWWIQYYHRGKLYRESSGSEKHAVAVKLLKQRLAEMGAGRVVGPVAERTTFVDLANLIVDDYRVNRRKSLWRVQISLDHLREHFEGWWAVDITTDRISRYIRERQEAGASPGTVVQEVACLRRMLNLAVRASE